IEGAMQLIVSLIESHQIAFGNGVTTSWEDYRAGRLNVQPILDALNPLLILIGTVTAVVMAILYLLVVMSLGLGALIVSGISLLTGVIISSFLSDGPQAKEDITWLSGMNPRDLMQELRNRYDPDPDPWDWGLAIASVIVGILAFAMAPGAPGAWMGFTFALCAVILLPVLSVSSEGRVPTAIVLLLLAALGAVGSGFGIASGDPVAIGVGGAGAVLAAIAIIYIIHKNVGL
ncbi:MAG: hypothetical protein ACE5IO_09660, partial [Thermoplasmata archaeon]